MAPIRELQDNFTDNSRALAWLAIQAGSGAVSEAAGRATCALPSSTAGNHNAYYRAAHQYDFTGDGAYININGMVSTGVAATFTFDVYLDGSNVLRWQQLSGTLTARTIIAGVDTAVYTVAWNATTFKYLRIRESGGSVFFDSSNNGTAWTQRATLANPFAVTALYVQFGCLCGNVASPGSLTIEDFNVATPSTTWRWTQGERESLDRMGAASLAASGGVAYIAIAATVDASGNLVSPRYFSGPLADGRQLTEQSSQAAAEALAPRLPTDGRWHLAPTVFVEGRYIRLYHRSHDGASYTLREYYPRRFTQTDDLAAEYIQTWHLAAKVVTADKISVLQLSALTADMGSITAGTITGAIIRTAASGARVELNSGAAGGLIGYGASDTYNAATGAGTYQLHWRLADGQLYAGAGAIRLGSYGIRAITPASYADAPSFGFYDAANSVYTGALQGRNNGNNWLQLLTNARASVSSYLDLKAEATTSGTEAQSRLWAQRSSAIAEVIAKATTAGLGRVEINADQVVINQGVTVGAVSSSGQLTGTALQTSNSGFNMSPRGAHIGSLTNDYIPNVGGDWPANTNLLINFLDHGSIGFHDAGTRADFITMTGGIMTLGYNAGWGAANIAIPGQRVGIGMGNTTVPTSTTLNVRSHVASSGENVLNVQNSSLSNLLTVRADGGLNGTIVAWTVTSDERAKRDIQPIPRFTAAAAAELLRAIGPSSFRLAEEPEDAPLRYGFIAQQFQTHELLRPLVREIGDNRLGLIYDGVIPILVRLVEHALERIEQLEAA